MKYKRRRVSEVPSKIRSFIRSVTSFTLEKIEEPLKGFVWDFDKGDFHHWVDLFNHFDSFFEKYIKSRKDLLLDDNLLGADPPFPREAVLQILRVIQVILDNCSNKHLYSSFEQHLSSLLSSTDADVVETSLQTLTAFLKKPVRKCSIHDSSLTSKLFSFSQGWGSKEGGLGLISCSLMNGCDPIAFEVGSTVHFEFYVVSDFTQASGVTDHLCQGLQVIHFPKIGQCKENDLELLDKLVKEENVPHNLRFSLLTRLRFARAFNSLAARHQYICIRLYAFMILVQASIDTDDLVVFFNNEPEFISELVSLLSYESEVPEKIRVLGIQSLVALCHDRSRQSTVLSSVMTGGHCGVLPSLMQKTVDYIVCNSGDVSIVFAGALLSFVSVLVSSTPGSLALQEAGYIPTILPLLKDTEPKHLQLVSTAVHIIEGFLDFNNPSAALFRDLGGFDDTITRLKIEVANVENGSKRNAEGVLSRSRGKQMVDSCEIVIQPYCSEASISYHRRLLLKALLRVISLATYVPGSSARIDGSEESMLPHCLCIIFRRAKDFGGGVFSLAAIVMSDLIHKDPTCYPVLDAADLPRAFLDAVMNGVPCSAEAVTCILQCLDALCLNNAGLQLVRERNALWCFVKIFTSRSYARALSGDITGSLSNSLDELLRHASSLCTSGVDMLVEILNTIANVGSVSESHHCSEFLASSVSVPMETCSDDKSVLSSEGEFCWSVSTEQTIDASSDAISLSVESFLPECISNTARLLETVLQNAEICRLFIEKKGIEAILKLFLLPSIPISVSIGENISVAFKKFSPQYSVALAGTVCSFFREHLKLTNEFLNSLCGSKLTEVESEKQMVVLKCMLTLEGLLSLVNFLLKGTTTMASELGSSDADILIELGKAYREVLWQISLTKDLKEKQDADHEVGIGYASLSPNTERESDDDGSTAPVFRYNNSLSIHNISTSHWNTEQEFVSYIPGATARNVHRHGRPNYSRLRGSRLSRNMDISQSDSDVSSNSFNNLLLVENKKKKPIILVSEVLLKLGFAIHSFHATLVKGLSSRRRTESSSLSLTSKSLVTALAKVFHDALTYSGHSSAGFETLLSVKCQYLGKVVEAMGVLVFDSRRRACNTALINSFYVNGTFKEILTTYEATSQLLWTLPFPFHVPVREHGTSADGKMSFDSSWLLDTLLSYFNLLEYHVNSSLLLSLSSPSQSQLLVQPVATGLSIGLFPIPRDPEVFVRMLQTQVLDAILPLCTHPMFPNCSPALISAVVSNVTHIYTGVGNIKRGHGIAGSSAQRINARPIDESSIATIVEMGFSRVRAEEALRNVGTNSVAIATDWLFNHPEEFVQEDVQLAQALALSLGNSSETSKDDDGDETKNVFTEEKGADIPPFDEIMQVSIKLLQGSDSMVFPVTDLLLTLCSRNKGEDRGKVLLYFIQQMKNYSTDFSKDIDKLFPMSHILALLLNEDSSTREIAAENGIVSTIIAILENVLVGNNLNTEAVITKFVSVLLLILNCMLQHTTKVPEKNSDVFSSLLPDSSKVDASLPFSTPVEVMKSPSDCLEKEPRKLLENILGKSTGYCSIEESRRAMALTCAFIKQQVSAMIMQAVLQLCARLTKTYVIATQFLENGTLAALFNLPSSCIFPGFDNLASTIIRHLLEDPQTLQAAMELEIRQTLSGSHSRHTTHLSPRLFLTSMAPVISRNPTIFMRAAVAVCQLESSGGRSTVVLTKEKDKDKPKAAAGNGTSINEPLRLSDTGLNDNNAKCTKSHKRVPANLAQVIDQLLEILMCYPAIKKQEDSTSSFSPMVIDKFVMKEKGKSKVDDIKLDLDGFSEKSALLAKVTFVLRLISDILLMYVHAVGVVLKRDSEMYFLRGSGQASSTGHGGFIYHILHEFLHISSEKNTECSDEQREKLSEKASWFLVVLSGRSMEGRRRVIAEIVKIFSSFSVLERNTESILLPDKNVLVSVDLVYSILSKNSSNNLPGSGCSLDIAKTMIDGGMVQALCNMIGRIDLDHPYAPKLVNLILKTLECLTRAANASDQVFKSVGQNKKRSNVTHERMDEQSNTNDGSINRDQNMNPRNTAAVQVEEQQIGEFHHSGGQNNANLSQNIEHEMRVIREEHADNPTTDRVRFIRQEINENGVIQNSNDIGLAFRIEQHFDDEMANEDEVMGDDGDDDDDEDDEEDDDNEEDIAEGTGLMSLASTDVDDHDGSGLVEEYNINAIDEEDDAFPENHVIEVRWREGLTGLDQLRVLRGSGNVSGFVDIASEPFREITADDIFSFQRSLGVDRRRPSGNQNFVDRSGFDVNAFQHPLLLRPSLSGETGTSIWPSAGNTSRNSGAFSVGSADLAHLYMFESGLSTEHAAPTLFGNNLVDSAPPFIDFSFGVDSLQMGPRRGVGDSLWTDDGLPQAGANAAAIAQAVEDQFVSQLRGIHSVSDPSIQRPSGHSVGQINQSSLLIANNHVLASIESDPFEPGEFQHLETGFDESAQWLDNVACEGPSIPSRGEADNAVAGIMENEGALEARQFVIDDPNVSALNAPERLLVWNEDRPITIPSHVPEMVVSSDDLHSVDQHMPYDSEALSCPLSIDSHNECRPGNSDFENHSSSQAVIDSGSTLPILSDGRAGPSPASADFDMNATETVGNQVNSLVPTNDELSNMHDASFPKEAIQNQGIVNNDSSSMNGIDPTFLEALPDDLRAEVLASQQAQSAGTSTYAPPAAEEIDPEFLAALPPDIQAEVLAQQRAQRDGHVQHAQGQPVDMDNASIIATFPPELREEVLLTSSDAVLSALPSALLAEAQMLRDRVSSHYSAHSRFFDGSQRLSSRRLTVDRLTNMDRGVGATIGPRAASAIASNLKVKETEGMPLVDVTSLRSLIRLLRVAQPLGKGLLQRLLLNLCAHNVTRANLVFLLVDIIQPEADALTGSMSCSQRLYGCQWNIIYGRPQPSNGIPPLLSRRVLEMLNFLATNHPSVASILFNFEFLLPSEPSACNTSLEVRQDKTNERICEPNGALTLESSQKGDAPLVLFLKLLNRPLFLRSNVHLEQVMGLVQVIVDNAVAKIDCQRQPVLAAGRSVTQADNTPSNSLRDSAILEQIHDQDGNPNSSNQQLNVDGEESFSAHNTFLQLPNPVLCNLCCILAHAGLSEKVYSLVADVMKKLAFVVAPHRKFFAIELVKLARKLSVSAVGVLATLRSTHMLPLGAGSMAGAAILRVLQTLSALITVDGAKSEEFGLGHDEPSILINLNLALEPLWQELSDCITATEAKLGQNSTFSPSLSIPDASHISGGRSTVSPLPPGTQQLLPFVEAFFIICEKLQLYQVMLADETSAAGEKEFSGLLHSSPAKSNGTSTLSFARIVEKHRRLLNIFVRQNPRLLEKSFSMMLKVPRLIDFDNKRAYFRSHIRQQHDQHPSAPLRVSIRRAYILEDSYNQLRLRSAQDLKGRLMVHFQGEEGIDAGGLTREWYQLLSRVIFDKGALLFTTVGNNATFQPNPNSVYQTEHLSYFKFVGRLVAKALFDGQLLDVHFTRSFYKHILGVKVSYHDIEAVDPDYYKNLKWMLENDISDVPDMTFSMDADEEKLILYEKNEVTDYELKPGGRNIRVTEETKNEYVDLVAEHRLSTAIRPQINSFLQGFDELVPRDLISMFNDKELELLISGLPEIDVDDLKANTEYTGYTTASTVVHWFWEVVKLFNKEDMARFLQFVTGTSKVPLEGFKALQGISGSQKFQVHKAYGAPERLPSAHTCFNQLDLPEYSSKEQLEERLLLAIHEASEGFGFG